MGKSSKKNGHKHKKHHQHRSSSASSNSNGEEQWQEAGREDNINDAPGGTVVKGPTMPTQADLEQLVK
jgi:hypothetical protein